MTSMNTTDYEASVPGPNPSATDNESCCPAVASNIDFDTAIVSLNLARDHTGTAKSLVVQGTEVVEESLYNEKKKGQGGTVVTRHGESLQRHVE
jgi:hypothetical protein